MEDYFKKILMKVNYKAETLFKAILNLLFFQFENAF